MLLLMKASLKADNAQCSKIRMITAADYALFLNDVAATDDLFLYDEKMEADPKTASIVRTGTPGFYSYAVITGREEAAIAYVSSPSEAFYCEWKKKGKTIDRESDFFLKSNQIPGIINLCEENRLSLVQDSSQSHITSDDMEAVGIIVALLVGLGMGGRYACDRCDAWDKDENDYPAAEEDDDKQILRTPVSSETQKNNSEASSTPSSWSPDSRRITNLTDATISNNHENKRPGTPIRLESEIKKSVNKLSPLFSSSSRASIKKKS